jgi:hypothetical protein
MITYRYEKTVLGWNWHVCVDGEMLFYPHASSKNLRGLMAFIHFYEAGIWHYLDDDRNNYSLVYHITEGSQEAQDALRKYCDEWGVNAGC